MSRLTDAEGGAMQRAVGLVLVLVSTLCLCAVAESFDFYRAGPNAVGLFNNLTGDEADGLILRFSGPIEPANAVGIGGNMQLKSNEDGELQYSGFIVPSGTWEVDWLWEGPRLEYAAWLRDGAVVEEIPVHNPTAVFGMTSNGGQRIRFFATGSADPDGYPLARYLWQWSDGVSAEGVSVKRSFAAGEYEVVLTVWDVDGNQASRRGRFAILEPRPRTYTLTINIVGNGSVAVQQYQVAYFYGDTVTLTAAPAEHWDFIGWSGDLAGTDDTATITIAGNTNVTANFDWHDYLLSVTPVGDGTVTPSPSETGYHYGTVVTLDPEAAEHWDFTGWSGDLSGTDDPATITIAGDTNVTANFDWHDYLLSVTTVGDGTVMQSPNQTGYHYGAIVVLDPQAASGWSFSGWNGDLAGTDDPATVTILGDVAITAVFDVAAELNYWVATFGSIANEIGRWAIPAFGGGYFVGGDQDVTGQGAHTEWVLKVNEDAEIEWQERCDGRPTSFDATSVADGGVVAAVGGSVQLLKLDAAGDLAWCAQYSGSGGSERVGLCESGDGGFVVASGASVIKTRSDGTVLWHQQFPSSSSMVIQDVQRIATGGYVVVGDVTVDGNRQVWVAGLAEATGLTQWQKTYGGTGVEEGRGVYSTQDGGSIVVGATSSYGAGVSDAWVLRLSATGEILWQRCLGTPKNDYACGVTQVQDGGFVVCGTENESPAGHEGDAWLAKLDSNGNLQWEKQYDILSREVFYNIEALSDGGLLASGNSEGGPWHTDRDPFVARLDEQGVIGAGSCTAISQAHSILTATGTVPYSSSLTQVAGSGAVSFLAPALTDTQAYTTLFGFYHVPD